MRLLEFKIENQHFLLNGEVRQCKKIDSDSREEAGYCQRCICNSWDCKGSPITLPDLRFGWGLWENDKPG